MKMKFNVVFILLSFWLAGCASTPRCESNDKSDYCENLRRGITPKGTPPLERNNYIPPKTSPDPIHANPHYNPVEP